MQEYNSLILSHKLPLELNSHLNLFQKESSLSLVPMTTFNHGYNSHYDNTSHVMSNSFLNIIILLLIISFILYSKWFVKLLCNYNSNSLEDNSKIDKIKIRININK